MRQQQTLLKPDSCHHRVVLRRKHLLGYRILLFDHVEKIYKESRLPKESLDPFLELENAPKPVQQELPGLVSTNMTRSS